MRALDDAPVKSLFFDILSRNGHGAMKILADALHGKFLTWFAFHE
jgi:hypothetical protein